MALVDEATRARTAALACWRGEISMEPLVGGITNRNFLVTDRTGRYVVRLGKDIPVHGIMRFNELTASLAAHAAGLSPRVVHAETGVLVLDYIDGITLGTPLLSEPRTLPRAVELVKRCHQAVAQHLRGPALMFWVFHVLRNYARLLQEQQSHHAAKLPQMMQCAVELERATGDIAVVFAHNDLLAANFIDDGKRLWLIDWDYAGFNSPLFDLGGLVSNNQLDKAQTQIVLQSYFGSVSDEVQQRFVAMKAASLLRETMWSMVSEIYSLIDFDYASYTRENLLRFERAYMEFSHKPLMPSLSSWD